MDFIWAENKLAIVEKEKPKEYETFQYCIEDQWTLLVCKNKEKIQGSKDPSWILKRIKADGKHVLLEGKSRDYDDNKSKHPKQS